jgi:hypothetical protein
LLSVVLVAAHVGFTSVVLVCYRYVNARAIKA